MALQGFFAGSELPMLKQDTARPQCGACGYKLTCKSPMLPPAGRGRKRILIVSAFPGKEEDDRGRLNVGDSSTVLRNAVGRAGLDLDRDCWLTNAVICKPANAKSVDAAVGYCRPNLVKTVTELNPEVIVTLGSEAVMSVMGWLWKEGEGGVMRWRGFQIPNRRINTWVAPTYHPAFLMRERDDVYDKMFLADLRGAFALKGRPYRDPPPSDMGDEILCEVDPGRACRRLGKFHRDLVASGRPVAFDFETTTLKPQGATSRIYSCAVSDGLTTIAYPWTATTRRATKILLGDPRVKKIGANVKFENNWCLVNGIEVRGWWWDVNLAAHAMFNASKVRSITSVDFQAAALLGVDDWAASVTPYLITPKGNGGYATNRIKDVPLPKILRYMGLDALYEHLICQRQRTQLGLTPLGD